MPRTHMILQGKGGVGKSFCAATYAQWLCHMGRPPLCIDTDPVNGTLAGFSALNVQRVEVMDADEINSRHFDRLVELISTAPSDVVVDNGASSFVPLSHYMLSMDVPSLLKDLDRPLVIHTVITGGLALLDTLNGFAHLASQFVDTPFFVWLNPYWGPVQHDGKDFETMKAYLTHKNRIEALIRVPTLKGETFGTDLATMLRQRQTFEQAIAAPERTIMERQRLKIIQGRLFAQLRASE
jgi:hypothetical protein